MWHVKRKSEYQCVNILQLLPDIGYCGMTAMLICLESISVRYSLVTTVLFKIQMV